MRSTVYELMKIPIWPGQRIIDTDHARKLGGDIKELRFLDKGYCVIAIPDEDAVGKAIVQRYIVDGQHRMKVLMEAREAAFYEAKEFKNFTVTYTEKRVNDQTEANDYFYNIINNAKPLPPPAVDPTRTVNSFVEELEEAFKLCAKACIKGHATKRPYLCIEDVREVLKKRDIDSLRNTKPDDFAKRVWEWNRKKIEEFKIERRTRELSGEVTSTTKAVEEKNRKKERCIAVDFALAYDDELPWIAACLQ